MPTPCLRRARSHETRPDHSLEAEDDPHDPARSLVRGALAACAGDAEPVPSAEVASAPAAEAVVSPIAEPACWLQGATSQEAAQRPSPRDSASARFGGGTLKVCYGAPSARGRTIIGGQDTYGQPWRMGADEATAFHTTVPITVGGITLAAGSYSLYGISDPANWTVVLNSQVERWGIPINDQVRAGDVGEFTVPTEATDPHVETLRYRFEPWGERRTDLLMEFESTRVRIPIQVAE